MNISIGNIYYTNLLFIISINYQTNYPLNCVQFEFYDVMVWWICMRLCKNHEFCLDYGMDYEIWMKYVMYRCLKVEVCR